MTYLKLILLIIPLTLWAQTGDRTGNGGDYVRSGFILRAQRILNHLFETRSGQTYCSHFQLNPKELELVLQTSHIEVTSDILRDPYGNIVDALGEKGKIILNKERWTQHFQSQADVKILIFHEVLRAAGLDDEDYKISKYLPAIKDDLFINLHQRFEYSPSSTQAGLRHFFIRSTRANELWKCSFHYLYSEGVFSTEIQINQVADKFDFLIFPSRRKVITNLSLYGKTKEIQIPKFPLLSDLPTRIKNIGLHEFLINFDGLLLGQCIKH